MALFRRRRGGRHASRPPAANPVGSWTAAVAVARPVAATDPITPVTPVTPVTPITPIAPPPGPPGAAVALILADGTHFALAAEDPGAEPFRALVGELLGRRDPTARA